MESSLPSLPTIDFLLEEPPNEHNFTTIQLQKARVFQKQCLEIWMDKYRHVKTIPTISKLIILPVSWSTSHSKQKMLSHFGRNL